MRGLLLVVPMLLFTAGCGPTCTSRCESVVRACVLVDPVSSCELVCTRQEAFLDSSGCGDDHEALQSCIDDEGDACRRVPEVCTAEESVYEACAFLYCRDNPDHAGC